MPKLEFRALQRTFGDDPPIVALREVNLIIEEGAYVAVQGPSGSGKTTLLNQIALIDRPTAGDYLIDGQSVAGLTERARARIRSDTFGFVFQSFHLMPHRSALENVALGLLYRGVRLKERRRRASAALREVGLDHRLDTSARKLSGGERQRVAIARATLGGAPIVVADEPTGNLDSVNGQAIIEQLDKLHAAGTTIVLVTHDVSVAANAQYRIQLADGKVASPEASIEVRPQGPLTVNRVPPGSASSLRPDDLFRESWHALRGRPGRTALLVAAVAIAVALVVITLGLAQTASAQVSSSFDVLRNREVTVTVPSGTGTDGKSVSGVPTDWERTVSQVRGVTQSGVVEEHDQITAQVPNQAPVPGLALAGISAGAPAAVGAVIDWAPGHAPKLGRHEVLIGRLAADQLGLGPIELDPIVTIGGTQYGVAGILESARRTPELASQLMVDWRNATQAGGLINSHIYLTTVGGAAAQVARQAPVAIDAVNADQMEVQAPPDPTSLRDAIQGDVRAALIALTLVASLASILGVANAMLLGVIERVGELGLRRAIGARPIHILGQTALEAFLAGVAGGIVGLCVGLATILADTVVNHWQPVIDLRLVPIAVVGGAVVGILGGLPASIRASRIQPTEALRR